MKKIFSIFAIATMAFLTFLPLKAQTDERAGGYNQPAPPPTLEQRISGLEAYINNGDPTASLKVGPKDKDGNPERFRMA